MITIHKYPVSTGLFEVEMPEGAEVLTVQMQGNSPCIWARVDSEAPVTKYHFQIVGTGQPTPSIGEAAYIDTFQMLGGQLIWHLFEVVP